MSLTQPQVAVVIPCFNDGQFLPEAVESVRTSRAASYELIVVNDGSNDPSTLNCLQELETSGVLVLHQSNQGLAAARNRGIAHAGTPYFLPLDADNRIGSEYLARAVDALQANPKADVAYSDREFFGARLGVDRVADFDLGRLLAWNYIDACAVVRRSAWERCGGYDEKMPFTGFEDWDLWCRIACSGGGFIHLPEVLHQYRIRPGQMSESMATSDRVEAVMRHLRAKPVTVPLGLVAEALCSWSFVVEQMRAQPIRTFARLLKKAYFTRA